MAQDEKQPQGDTPKAADHPLVRSEADRAADRAPGDRVEGEDLAERQDRLLDEALEESFPGSDPISPSHIT